MGLSMLLLLLIHLSNALDPNRPNFIFFLTDDQDLLFDSMSYMPFTYPYLQQNGVEFTNSFISTPICCPSRTESITGRGFQNIQNGPIDCMDISATYNVFNNTDSMFQLFANNGYLTGSFGKLTNNMNNFWCNKKTPPMLDGFHRINCPCDYSYVHHIIHNISCAQNVNILTTKRNQKKMIFMENNT